jgi:hypothetical protein
MFGRGADSPLLHIDHFCDRRKYSNHHAGLRRHSALHCAPHFIVRIVKI